MSNHFLNQLFGQTFFPRTVTANPCSLKRNIVLYLTKMLSKVCRGKHRGSCVKKMKVVVSERRRHASSVQGHSSEESEVKIEVEGLVLGGEAAAIQ